MGHWVRCTAVEQVRKSAVPDIIGLNVHIEKTTMNAVFERKQRAYKGIQKQSQQLSEILEHGVQGGNPQILCSSPYKFV
jgi:Holliday junction resolvase